VEGSIVDGPSFTLPLAGTKFCGSTTIVKALEEIEKDVSVRAVLVRVDSPGGSALASELMNRALARVAAVKPVAVSMGNTAASGGYYLAVAGHRIFAMPGTVTGSIGIWFGKVVATGLLDKLKIRRVQMDRGKNASLLSYDRRLTPEELEEATQRMAETYQLFIQRVSEGRNMTPAQVETLAQGRVWSGQRAVENGLADEQGGALEALAWLKNRLGMPADRRIELVHYPLKSFGERLAEAFTGAAAGSAVQSEMAAMLESLARLADTGTWAMDPWLPVGW